MKRITAAFLSVMQSRIEKTHWFLRRRFQYGDLFHTFIWSVIIEQKTRTGSACCRGKNQMHIFLDIYWERNLACFLNVNEQCTQEEPEHFFTELNTYHAYTNCSDSILKNRVRAEFLLLMLALLLERNNQKTDLHCMSILTSKSRNKSLVTLSSCTMTVILWILTELVLVILVQVDVEKKAWW